MGEEEDVSVKHGLQDVISSVHFGEDDVVLATAWDGCAEVFRVEEDVESKLKCSVVNKVSVGSPLLSASFVGNNGQVAVGCLNGEMALFDIAIGDGSMRKYAGHKAGVRCLNECKEWNLVLTGSWDGTVKAWDPRAKQATGVWKQPNKVFAMDALREVVLVGHAGRTLTCLDVRKPGYFLKERNSGLQFQTRCLKLFDDGNAFALGCIGGRVIVDYLNESKPAFKFKCHRTENAIFPVNTIATHPVYGTFATGGCDSMVSVWDPVNQKKVSAQQFPNTVACLDFNERGNLLAAAVAYTFENGDVPEKEQVNEIRLRTVPEKSVKPRLKRKK